MKRHTQTTGIRNWYGEDLLDLQKEPLKVLDRYFTQFGNCVIRGCEMTEVNGSNGVEYKISSGLVAMRAQSSDGKYTNVIAEFAGDTVDSPTAYLYVYRDVIEDIYNDGNKNPTAYHFYALATTDRKEVNVSAADTITIKNGIQPTTFHKLVNDTLNHDFNREYDFVISGSNKIKNTITYSEATSVLVKKGDQPAGEREVVSPKLRRMVGETGAKFVYTFDFSDRDFFLYKKEENSPFCIENIDFEINIEDYYLYAEVFVGVDNIRNCNIRVNLIGEDAREVMFSLFYKCSNIENCRITVHDSGKATGSPGLIKVFDQCQHIRNCNVIVESESVGADNHKMNINCFDGCSFLDNCNVKLHKANPNVSLAAFVSCKQIQNSGCILIPEASAFISLTGFLFSRCESLVNCWASTSNITASTFSLNLFYECKGMLYCNAKITYRAGSTNGVGIMRCTGVQFCKTNVNFNDSYFSTTSQTTNACANTIAGGWNMVTDDVNIPEIDF